MNRFKRELRKNGIKLENDFEYLPCNGIETIIADAEKAMLSIYHVSAGWVRIRYNRAMKPENA